MEKKERSIVLLNTDNPFLIITNYFLSTSYTRATIDRNFVDLQSDFKIKYVSRS